MGELLLLFILIFDRKLLNFYGDCDENYELF